MGFRIAMGAAVSVVLALAGGPAIAQEAPETVYQRFHQAVKANDVGAMMRVASAERAREIADSWWLERKFMAVITPDTYKLTSKQVSADGNRMQIRGTGLHSFLGGQPTLMYGVVDLIRVKGEWKVDKVGWAHDEWPAEKI